MIDEAVKIIDTVKTELREISTFLHEHPETAFQEFEAKRKQVEFLREHGFHVTEGYGGLETAYRATGGGEGEKGDIHFAILSEYDALPGSGHACGHNLICVSALAAGIAAAELVKKAGIKAKINVIGCPAEEGKGGKVIMKKAGAFAGLDGAIISHPYDVSSTDAGALSLEHCRVVYHGKASHAGMSPELGINALAAVIQLFNGVNAWRQTLPENSRVHGIITNGGKAANIIPDYAEAQFYVRAPDKAAQEQMGKQFRAIAEAAALSTGAKLEFEKDDGYQAIKFNRTLNEAYAEGWRELGEEILHVQGNEGRASTDFGDVSQLMPGANVHFGICGKEGTPLHSVAFREAAGTEFGFGQAMKTAAVMAEIAVRFCSDESFRQAAQRDFMK